MNKNFSISGIGLLAFILGLAALPADARDRDNGHMNAVQMQTVNNLNNQRTQIDAKLNAAIANRTINPAQAASIRSQITANANLQTQYLNDGMLDVTETQALMSGLGTIETSITTASSVTNVPPRSPFDSGRSGNGYRSNRNLSRIVDQRAQVEAKISSYLASNKINQDQAAKQRNKIGANLRLQEEYMKDGVLSNAECDTLRKGLESLDNSVEFSVKFYSTRGGNPNPGPLPPVGSGGPGNFPGRGHAWGHSQWNSMYGDISTLETNISNLLTQGRKDGRLTNNEYADLRGNLDRIQDRTDTMRDSGGRFTAQEKEAIVNQLTGLQNKINKELHDRDVAGQRNGRKWY